MRSNGEYGGGSGKPETFNFLGFTHICGRSRQGVFQLKRQTRRDRMRAKLRALKEELRRRMHEPISLQGKWLRQVVRGYFADHAVPTNCKSMSTFQHYVMDLWRRGLQRRSQRDRSTWERIAQLAAEFLPLPRISVGNSHAASSRYRTRVNGRSPSAVSISRTCSRRV
jgi:RNA-directed DNA polymerase